MPTWIVSAFLDDDLLALNRAIGIIRRRNLVVPSMTLGPSARAGITRMGCVVEADEAAVERMANQLRKMVGMHAVQCHPESNCATREHLMVRTRVEPARLSGLLDTIALYDARVVEEGTDELLLEATGTSPRMVSLLRALEPYGILDLARGGCLSLPSGPPPEDAAAAPSPATSQSPIATAISA